MKLHSVFATTDLSSSLPMIQSMNNALPDWELSFEALLIGKNQRYSHSQIPIFLSREDIPPIHTSRNLCQVHLQKKMLAEGGIGLVLDDDFRWVMPQSEFNLLIDQLSEANCDMAFSILAGDPPIPKEYTRASSLLDVLISHSNNSKDISRELTEFLSSITIQKNDSIQLDHTHHDFYAFNKKSFSPAQINLDQFDWIGFIEAIEIGKKTTRPTHQINSLSPSHGRERGGATLVFNPDVLKIKNKAITVGPWTSRRSDMLMAMEAYREGFYLYKVPALFSHERKCAFDSHNPKKLIGDILGYALVESFHQKPLSPNHFKNALRFRIRKTQDILQNTNTMLSLLPEVLATRFTSCMINAYKNRFIDIIHENKITNQHLHTLYQKMTEGQTYETFLS